MINIKHFHTHRDLSHAFEMTNQRFSVRHYLYQDIKPVPFRTSLLHLQYQRNSDLDKDIRKSGPPEYYNAISKLFIRLVKHNPVDKNQKTEVHLMHLDENDIAQIWFSQSLFLIGNFDEKEYSSRLIKTTNQNGFISDQWKPTGGDHNDFMVPTNCPKTSTVRS